MKIGKLMFVLVTSVIGCAPAAQAPQQNAQVLAEQFLKIVRLEQRAFRGEYTPDNNYKTADSLFVKLTRGVDMPSFSKYAKEGIDSSSGSEISNFVEKARALPAPESDQPDPADAVLAVLRRQPGCPVTDWQLMQAYGGAFLVVLEDRRNLTMRVEISQVLMALGCPVTFAELGYSEVDTPALLKLAEKISAACGDPRWSALEPFDYLTAMRRLNDTANRFGRRVDAEQMAGYVLERSEVSPLIPGLEKLKPTRIVFLGDSQTDNRHWSSPAHFPNIISAVFNKINPSVATFNAGVGGDDSGEALARLEKDVIAEKPDLCFVLLGGNDCAYYGSPRPSVTVEQYDKNIRAIVKRVQQIGCRAVLMAYPTIPEWPAQPDNADLTKMNRVLRQICLEKELDLLDVRGVFDSGDYRRFFALDRIHFGPEGHLTVAAMVLDYLAGR
ncbi:GDSL-type esterase/lipase family protein [Gemmatimonadota bacterium]